MMGHGRPGRPADPAGGMTQAGAVCAANDGPVAGGYFDGNGGNAVLAMNGKVGIGIINPTSDLHIYNSGATPKLYFSGGYAQDRLRSDGLGKFTYSPEYSL